MEPLMKMEVLRGADGGLTLEVRGRAQDVGPEEIGEILGILIGKAEAIRDEMGRMLARAGLDGPFAAALHNARARVYREHTADRDEPVNFHSLRLAPRDLEGGGA